MTNRTRLELLIVSVVLMAAALYLKPTGAPDATFSFAPLLQRVTPAVVNVAAFGPAEAHGGDHLAGSNGSPLELSVQSEPAQNIGSGVIVDAEQGLILTNRHVVQNATQIVVTLTDRRQLDAVLVASDPGTDVALLRVTATDLVALPFGDSDRLKIGDVVIAIGNPFGLGQTATSGIVSALGRGGMTLEGYENYIQTDASINPGSSGGPLIDTEGRMMGLNTAILAPAGNNVGIGFAIPSNMAHDIALQLVKHGEVRRGRLGIKMQDVTPPLSEALALPVDRGALVTEVEPLSPADQVGIVAGDVIAAINGAPLMSSTDLRNQIGVMRIGQEVALDVLHDGSARTVRTRLGEVTARRTEGVPIQSLEGAQFADASPAQWGRPAAAAAGAYVIDVEDGSPAARQGLHVNDIVVGVNRRTVESAAELAETLRATSGTVALAVERGGRRLLLLVR